MKTLNYDTRNHWLTTITVGELIAKLQQYDPDLAVLPTWESIFTCVKPEGFQTGTVAGVECLIINVDQWQ